MTVFSGYLSWRGYLSNHLFLRKTGRAAFPSYEFSAGETLADRRLPVCRLRPATPFAHICVCLPQKLENARPAAAGGLPARSARSLGRSPPCRTDCLLWASRGRSVAPAPSANSREEEEEIISHGIKLLLLWPSVRRPARPSFLPAGFTFVRLMSRPGRTYFWARSLGTCTIACFANEVRTRAGHGCRRLKPIDGAEERPGFDHAGRPDRAR